MSSAKKGKKIKGRMVPLGEFLGARNTSGSAVLVPQKSSWADESEDYEDDRYGGPTEKILLPTAPRQARGPNIDLERVPNSPPFYAQVSNLSFEADEEDVVRFFKGLKIVNIRLPRGGGEHGRFEGYGFVEFETKSDLLEALGMNEEIMRTRKIRVEIVDEDRALGRRDGPSRRDNEREDRSGGVSDWRAAPREDRSPNRDRYDDRDDKFSRNRDRSFGERDRGYGDRERGFNDRDRDRDRGYNDRERGYSDRERSYNDRERGFNDRDRSYNDRGRGGYNERERYGDRGYGERDRSFGERGFNDRDRNFGGRDKYDNRGYRGSGDRDGYDRDYERGRFGGGSGGGRYEDRRGGGGGYRRDDDKWRSRGDGREENRGNESPKERPRLKLMPRTIAVEEKAKEPAPPASNPSIFGDAKPVNTAQREFEIEKKLEKEKDIFVDAKPAETEAKAKKPYVIKRDEKEAKSDVKRSPNKLEKRDKDDESDGNGEEEEVEEEGEEEEEEEEEKHNDKNNAHLNEKNASEKEQQNVKNEESKNKKSEKGTKSKKGKKSKDEDLIINTTNKFSELGLGEEEA